MPLPPRHLVITWLVLLVLLASNIALAFFLPHLLALLINLLIAGAMAAFVLIFFMELRRSAGLFWVFAGAGFFWLGILFFLTAADYLTRYSFAPT